MAVPVSTSRKSTIYTFPSGGGATQGDNDRTTRMTHIHSVTGEIWVAYGKNASADAIMEELAVAYSDDNGATWTEEIVDVEANMGSSQMSTGGLFLGEANNGDMVVMASGDTWTEGNDRTRIYRRTGVDTWAAKAVMTMGGSSVSTTSWRGPQTAIYNHPDDDDTWIIVTAAYQLSGSYANLCYYISSDNLATVGSAVVMATGTNNRSNYLYSSGGSQTFRSSDKRTIIITYTLTTGTTYLGFKRITDWDTTPAVLDTNIIFVGGTNAWQDHIGWWSGANQITMYCTKNTTLDRHKYVIDNVETGVPSISGGDTTLNQSSSNDESLPSHYDYTNDVVMFHGERGGVEYVEWMDPSDDSRNGFVLTATGYTIHGEGQPVGVNAAVDHGYIGSDNARFGIITGMASLQPVRSGTTETLIYVETDNIEYGSGGGIPTQLVTDSISFSAEGAPIGENPTTISSTRTAYTYGGRQMIRDSSGTEHMLVDGASAGLFLFSRADGLSAWTATTILADGTTFDAAALHLDAEGEP